MEYSLERMSLMQELIGNVFLAKVTLWDGHFIKKIQGESRIRLAAVIFIFFF